MQEGEQHARTLLLLKMLCERSEGFSDVSIPNATLFGLEGTGHRFPDLSAIYQDKRLVFELQLSKTYLPTISDRDSFYRRNRIYLVWLFGQFEKHKERQTERDIVALRSQHAYELDEDAVLKTLALNRLHLRVHWQTPEYDGAGVNWRWKSEVQSLDHLDFDPYLVHVLTERPSIEKAKLLRSAYADVIERFEKFWFEKDTWRAKLCKDNVERFRKTGVFDETKTWEAVSARAFTQLIEISGMDSSRGALVERLKFDQVLDRVFFLRDNKNHANKQNLSGAIHSVLDNWPHFTAMLFAVASAYGRENALSTDAIRRKVQENLLGPQCHDFDALIALFCPEAAEWLLVDPILS